MTILLALSVQPLYASDFDESILQVDNPDYEVNYEPAERAPAADSPEIPIYVDEAKETAQTLKEKELLKKYYEMEKKEKRAKSQNSKKKKSGFRAKI